MDIYFHLFAVMYNAAVIWKSLFKILISILSDKCHVMDQWIKRENLQLFSGLTALFYILTNSAQCPNFPYT